MKKLILTSLFISFNSFGNIIVKDIPDFTFSQTNNNYDFDFNTDGTNEFSFHLQGNSVFSLFNANTVNFVTIGTQAGGGWDIIKYLPIGTVISTASNFAAAADAYINPDWAFANEMFPAGDSYIGTTFKIGSDRYFGWILVNSTGGNSGIITIKSYAYNNIPNQQINTGQTLGNERFTSEKFTIFPNPINYTFKISSDFNVDELKITLVGLEGQIIIVKSGSDVYDISHLNHGVYYLRIEDSEGEVEIKKIVKN